MLSRRTPFAKRHPTSVVQPAPRLSSVTSIRAPFAKRRSSNPLQFAVRDRNKKRGYESSPRRQQTRQLSSGSPGGLTRVVNLIHLHPAGMRALMGCPFPVMDTEVGPPLLSPQHLTSPLASAAQLACLAAEIAMALLMPLIAVGVF